MAPGIPGFSNWTGKMKKLKQRYKLPGTTNPTRYEYAALTLPCQTVLFAIFAIFL
jgi:hypothetical protein